MRKKRILVGVREIAEYFGTTKSTAHRWIVEGKLPARKMAWRGCESWTTSVDAVSAWIIEGYGEEQRWRAERAKERLLTYKAVGERLGASGSE